MTTNVYLSPAPAREFSPSTAADLAAMAQFQSALDACVHSWNSGNSIVLLQSNIQELFGNMLLQYFKQSLTQQVGQPLAFTFSSNSNGGQTIVQMPEQMTAQLSYQLDTITHKPAAAPMSAGSRKMSAGVKKAPRPMNCWIIFRDAMHKQLKAENPHLTVQQISTRCAEIWRSLSAAEKKPWQAQAELAKKEHLREHPDYKYSPRKPGEKKKRQTRKPKQAPAFAADLSLLNFSPIPDLASPSPDDLEPATMVQPSPSTVFESPIEFGTAFAADVAQLMEPTTLLGLGMVDLDYQHNSESLRHDRLEAEFGADLDGTMPFDLFGEEAFAFRAGADGNATLPSIYSDLY
ncbi:mat1-2 mating type protein [Didymella heteroderae]|uniref:Mat1-2 mating type protein n=1 Tax=Didymella heteroderae TaxID=1769908 RepID=A0A9P5BYR4_9PLEO|nr:mat1-2 mating type protein [Didymella heteroderae]